MKRQDGYVFYLWVLTGFFILLEVSFFIQCNSSYLSDFTFVTHNLHIPYRILLDVVFFLTAQLFIHSLYTLLVWLVTYSILEEIEVLRPKALTIAISIWVLGIATILIANQYYFPNSKFSGLLSYFIHNGFWLKTIYIFLLTTCIVLFVPTLMVLFALLRRSYSSLVSLSIFAMVMTSSAYHSLSMATNESEPSSLPNIIIIGVDSLRPDFLGFFAGDGNTPFIDNFLNQSTVFSEAITPLARTFPSWTSILTGRYPKETNIRSNLANYKNLDLSSSLATILKEQGYQTVFATDETRFSNIDHAFGFGQVITPPIGLADFLIGTFNDFPLSNLLINTTAGKWLFPFSYSNRAVYHTYEPDTFLSLIKANLKVDTSKPLFLVTHFCLTHYPYLWSSLPMATTSVWQRYLATVDRVDKQIATFMTFLQQEKLLDHAMVILLSDHGEALEFPGDRITEAYSFYSSTEKKAIPKFYPPSLDDESLDQSAGHGTDVLGLPQYHTLLAFKIYDNNIHQRASIVSNVVSLIDIKPTILNYIFTKDQAKNYVSSGNSLFNYINGDDVTLNKFTKHLFLESDYSPAAIRTVYPETRKVLLEGVALFEIDPKTTRLTVKKKMTEMIVRSKQYADIYGEWMLALYPQNEKSRMPILINLRNGMWTNDLQSNFALQSPAEKMLGALHAFFGDELHSTS